MLNGSYWYWLRDAAGKAARRVKKLVGRPDPRPWVVRPRAVARGEGVDVEVRGAAVDSAIVRVLREACSPRGLSVRVTGVEGRGVTISLAGVAPATFDREDALAKVRVAGVELNPASGRAAVRVYHVFGDQSLLRWSSETDRYESFTWADVRERALMPAFELAERVAAATGSEFFSVGVGVVGGESGRHVVTEIGEVAFDAGAMPPAEWLGWFCERVADRAWRARTGVGGTDGHGVWLPGDRVVLGTAQVPATINAV